MNWRCCCRALTEALSGHSLFARADETRRGYLTLRGGHRMGLCGHITRKNGQSTLRDIASVCIRIAGEWRGCADGLISRFPALFPGKTPSVLIIGAPGSGKTTLLRDLTRQMADTMSVQAALIDERGELAACVDGVPQLDVGASTDVLDGLPKTEGVPWLIRSMAPNVIAMDELSGAEDAACVMDAWACGASVLATVHGTALAETAATGTTDAAAPGIIAPVLPAVLRPVCAAFQRGRRENHRAARPLRQPDSTVMTRLLFPICAALLSTLAGLHLSTHLRQEEQRLARWGEILQHLHLLMASCAYSLPEAFRLCADGNHPPDTLLRQLADALERAPLSSPGALTDRLCPAISEKDIISRMMHLLSRGSLESRLLAVENARQDARESGTQGGQGRAAVSDAGLDWRAVPIAYPDVRGKVPCSLTCSFRLPGSASSRRSWRRC